MWDKLLELIKSGRLGEPSTYAGIAALVVSVYNLIGQPLVNPETGQAITPDILATMIANPFSAILLAIGGVAALVAIFRREGQSKKE